MGRLTVRERRSVIETGAEVVKTDDEDCYKILQSRSVDAGYHQCNFSNCQSTFADAWAPLFAGRENGSAFYQDRPPSQVKVFEKRVLRSDCDRAGSVEAV